MTRSRALTGLTTLPLLLASCASHRDYGTISTESHDLLRFSKSPVCGTGVHKKCSRTCDSVL